MRDDAVALLEWLETRLADKLEGKVSDSRDRLTDILGALKESQRALDRWRADRAQQKDLDAELARRPIHLLVVIDEAVHEISEELLSFRSGMLAFAARPYDLSTLREILRWLERYVTVYLSRIEELRQEIEGRLATLLAPRYQSALGECHDLLAAERASMPRAFRSGGAPRSPAALLHAQKRFFEKDGRLAMLCARIDDSARAVLHKMHRHIRELERRSARLADLRGRIREIASLEDGTYPALQDFTRRLLGVAHGRFDRRAPGQGERARPPLPRSVQASPRAKEVVRPLRPKAATPEAVRELRAKREAELRRWLETTLGQRQEVRLSELGLVDESAPRRWLDVARTHHLAGGRSRAKLGIELVMAPGPPAGLGTNEVGLEAPDCVLRVPTGGVMK